MIESNVTLNFEQLEEIEHDAQENLDDFENYNQAYSFFYNAMKDSLTLSYYGDY